jgi:cobalt-zinc-cadmium efflux system protein
VLVRKDDDCHGIREQLENVLRAKFAIEHTILQVDHAREPGQLLQLGDHRDDAETHGQRFPGRR